MAEVRILRTDLPAKHRKPILQAVQLLHSRIFTGSGGKEKKINAQRAEFARQLKASLDESFEPHWHVLVGAKSGFACKKRNESMAIFKMGDSQVVIWQSPGLEPLEDKDALAPAENETKEGDGAEDGPASSSKPVKVQVLEPEDPQSDSEEARVIAALKEELTAPVGDEDPQVLAQRLRKRLTTDFGTIWHVIAGPDFVAEGAADRRNHVLLTAGKVRVLCFQHEQFKGGTKVEWEKLMKSLPYFLLMVFCLGYMTMTAVCGEADSSSSPIRTHMRATLCQGDWETNVNYVGAAAMVCLFFGRFVRRSAPAPTVPVAAQAAPAAKESKKGR